MLSQMDSRISKKYYLIPLLYIGLIGVLLYLQFAREEPLHLRFGILEVSGHVIAGQSNPPALANVTLHVNGLSFAFSRSTPVRVESENGPAQTVSLKSYTTVPNGIELTFSAGLGLRFTVDANDALSIVPSTPEGVQVSSVSFPYSVGKGEQTQATPGIPALAVTRQTSGGPETHVLSLPFNSEIHTTDHMLVLTATGGKFGAAVYKAASKANESPVLYWFGQNGELPSSASYDKEVKAFLDKAWNGWTSTRFDAKAGTWEMRDGSPTFKESIVNAVLAEALARGSYTTWFQQMSSAASLHAQDITLETTPYFGNLAQTYKSQEGQFAQELLDDQTKLQQPDEAPLAIPDMLKFMTDHGSESTVQAVLTEMQSAKTADLSMQSVLGLLGDDLAARNLGYTADSYSSAASELIDQRVLPAIIRTENGFFLQTETGAADIASSVLAGRMLIEAGNRDGNRILSGIGRELVMSALSLSDGDGFLPGRLSISGDAVAASEGFLTPEKIYPVLTPNTYYPREISLASKVGQGVWAWAASRIVSVDSTQKQIAVTFEFPVGQIEHIVLHGIRPFTGITMYGLAWRSDPEFERYAAGWVYDQTTETLFIKLQHKQQDETITINY